MAGRHSGIRPTGESQRPAWERATKMKAGFQSRTCASINSNAAGAVVGTGSAEWQERSHRRTAATLALLAFFIYNVNLRSITSFDTYSTRMLPISIIRHFTLTLDDIEPVKSVPSWYLARGSAAEHRGNTQPRQHVKLYWVVKARGHYVSKYPVMPAILATPVYLIPVLLHLTDGPPSAMGFSRTEIVATMLSKLAGSLAAALGVAILYLTLLRLTNPSWALWLAALYAFASSTWSLSSQGLWQSSMSQPLLALTIYFLVRAQDDPKYAVHASAPLALAVTCRPPVAVYALVLLIYVYRAHRAQLARFLVLPTIVGALFFAYNLYYFGDPRGGYSGDSLSVTSLGALAGLLLSPSRGILVYSPFLVLGFAGLIAALTDRRDLLLTHLALASIALLLLYASWWGWDGAYGYSYRFLVDLLPGLVVLMATRLHWVRRRRWRIVAFASVVLFSVAVQVVGVFFYPCGWYETPVSAERHRERYWDWRDPEFVRCACAGPVQPEGLDFLRELWRKRSRTMGENVVPNSPRMRPVATAPRLRQDSKS